MIEKPGSPPSNRETSIRVVVLGGGFGGVKCARILRKKLRRTQSQVVLFNRENHMVFHPLLAEVAGGSVNPEAVAAPLRQMLPGVLCRTEDVIRIDPERKVVIFEGYDGGHHEMAYDQLVLACGSVVNLGRVPGMADHSFPLKTIGDAVALRAHVMQQLEKAEVCDDRDQKRFLLSFVIVGGGFSGVEVAGEINSLARGSLRFFQNISREDIRVTLVHSRDQILPEVSSPLREFARVKMEAAGIDMVLGARVAVATSEGVRLQDGKEVSAGTVVCTVGNAASPVVEQLAVEKERGRLLTDPDLRLRAQSNLWAIGDCALIENEHDGKLSPPTGQFAERQGRHCAENILRVLGGEATQPFSYKPVGQLCAVGHHTAIAEVAGMRISGFLAWFLWRGIYLSKLPSWSRRCKVAFDWAWQLFFSRDLSHLKTDRTERISTAYYPADDFVFHQGDPATSFFAIESGEAEVVLEEEGEEPRRVAILGPGDFFGEMALVNNKPRSAGVRARTELKVVVMGSQVFEQLSGSLAPVRELVTKAVQVRAKELKQMGADHEKTQPTRTS